jgi:hypothetical protein
MALAIAPAVLALAAPGGLLAADTVIKFVLIDAATDTKVPGLDPLLDGAVIPLNPAGSYSIAAVTSPSTVDGVSFELERDGAVVREQVELNPPYALFGNDGQDYLPWNSTFDSGVTYTVRAWTVDPDTGLATSPALEVSFSFAPASTGASPISSFTLLDADQDSVIAGFEVLSDGSVLDLSTLPRLALRANARHDLLGSIRFVLRENGQVIYTQIEDNAPFAVFGNSGGDYAPWPDGGPRPGSHYELEAVPYELDEARGAAGPGLDIHFETASESAGGTCASHADCDDGLFCNGSETCGAGACQAGTPPCSGADCNEAAGSCSITPAPQCSSNFACDDDVFCNGAEWCDGGSCRAGAPPCGAGLCNESSASCGPAAAVAVTRLRLIDAAANKVIAGFDPLVNGDILNVDDLPALNFEALTQPAQVGWVDLELRRAGELIHRHTESGAPYAVFGNSGADFASWNDDRPGYNYTLTATPFTAAGAAGTSLTVLFSITDDDQAPIADAELTAAVVEDLDGNGSVTVTLDGGASRGVAAGLTRWEWYDLENPGDSDLLGNGKTLPVTLGLGLHTIGLIVEDAAGGRSARDERHISVLPHTPRQLGHLGSFRRWHKVEISFPGPIGSTDGQPNPFDIQMQVTFSGPGGTHVVPAFYDGDGQGGNDGNVWSVRFSPPGDGAWSFISSAPEPSLAGFNGTFAVTAPLSTAPQLLRHGPLRYAGGPYLRHAGGPFWIKSGMDDPENILGDAIGGWNAKKDVIDFISERGVNSVYMVMNNVDGDRNDTWPWLGDSAGEVKSGAGDQRFDVGRLAEWEDFFSYCESRDVVLHLVLDDDEVWTDYDHERYYREMVARFAHHPGLIWNISEEADENYSDSQQRQLAARLRGLDPYDHPITVHRWVQTNNELWPFIDEPDAGFDLASIQAGLGGGQFSSSPILDLNTIVRRHRDFSEDAGRPLPVMIDEFPGINVVNTTARFDLRRKVIWPVLLGGGNLELHYRDAWSGTGSLTPYSLGPMWEDLGQARGLLELLPFETMRSSNSLLSASSSNRYCLASPGVAYAIYLSSGGNGQLDLRGVSGSYQVVWYDVRSGQTADGLVLKGGAWNSLGTPPFTSDVAAAVVHFDWLPEFRERESSQ